jgi:hypothetical protein
MIAIHSISLEFSSVALRDFSSMERPDFGFRLSRNHVHDWKWFILDISSDRMQYFDTLGAITLGLSHGLHLDAMWFHSAGGNSWMFFSMC